MRAKRGKITFERGDLVEWGATHQGKIYWREYHLILDFNCFEYESEVYTVRKYSFDSNGYLVEEGVFATSKYSKTDGCYATIIAKANKIS